MTTNPRGNSRTPQDLAELRQQLGTDNADAVARFVDGRIDAAIQPLAERIAALEPGTPGRAAASQAVRTAAADPTPGTVEAAEQAVAAAEASATSGAESAPEQPVQAAPPVSQPSAVDGRTLAGAHARIDQIEARVGEVQAVSATAFASVRFAGDGAARRALRWGMATFVITFIIYVLVIFVDNRTWNWGWAIVLPSVAFALVATVVYLLMHEDGPAAETFARADAIMARWGQQNTAAVDDDSTVAQAGAHASVR